MIQIKFSMRPYIKGSTGQVGIKVRWNQSKSEVSFFTKYGQSLTSGILICLEPRKEPLIMCVA